MEQLTLMSEVLDEPPEEEGDDSVNEPEEAPDGLGGDEEEGDAPALDEDEE